MRSNRRALEELTWFAPARTQGIATDLALELLEMSRRVDLAYSLIGVDSEIRRIAGALLQRPWQPPSTTILLNETGLSRTTLNRRLERLHKQGMIKTTSIAGQTHYCGTWFSARLTIDATRETYLIARGARAGFSASFCERMIWAGFMVSPLARTVAFTPR